MTESIKRPTRVILFLVAGATLAACQPTVEERLARAQGYLNEHEYRAAVIELKNILRSNEDVADARELLAAASYRLGDYETARTEYARAVELGNDSLPVLLSYGRTLVEMGQAEAATTDVLPRLPADGGNPAVEVLIGDVLLATGSPAEAEPRFRAALQQDSTNSAANVGLANIAADKGSISEAFTLLNSATSENPDSVLAWRALGDLNVSQGNSDDATAAYTQAVNAETPETPFVGIFLNRLSLIGTYLASQDFDNAELWLAELEELVPEHIALNYLRGRIYFGKGQFDLAQAELQEYISAAPNDPQGQAILGAVNFSQNHLLQAEMYLSRAVRENVGGEMTRRLLAETQLRLDKPADALESLTALGGQDSDDPVLLTMMSRAELGLGNSASAIAYLERSVAANPDDPQTSISLAAVLLANGEYERAIELLESLPAESDRNYRRESLIIAAHLRGNDREAAIREAEQLVSEHTEDAVAYVIAANLHQTLGDADRAQSLLNRALELDSNNAQAHYSLGQIALGKGDSDSAEEAFRAALESDVTYLPALAALADLLTEQGRFATVAPLLDKSIAAMPSALGPRLLQAKVLLTAGEFTTAQEAVADAREIHGDEPSLIHMEGLVQVGLGQTEVALRNLETAANALQSDPRVQLDAARQHLIAGEFTKSIKFATRYRALRPQEVVGLAIQVEGYARNGDFAEAKRALEDFDGADEVRPLTEILAGDIEMIDGKPEAAVEHYEDAASEFWSRMILGRLVQAYQTVDPARAVSPLERWLSENPDDTQMRRIFGQILEATGRHADAVEQYEALVNVESEDPVALNNLAWQYAIEGKDGALELAERAHKLAPDNGSIADTLGWILHLQGNNEQAEDVLRNAVSLSPDNPEVKYHLAVVLAENRQHAEAKRLLTSALEDHSEFPSRGLAEQLMERI